MQLENSFTVPVPIDEAWRVLLDIERIAPCMPGAALDSVDGDDFTGRVKVKLGPINLTYQGKASFIEKDEAAHKAVIDARGKDQRGNGTAAAVVTAKLKAEGAITRVDVLTDLNITGRPAQFGRGVMTDVGNKLLGQFADKLAAQLGEGDAQGDAGARRDRRREGGRHGRRGGRGGRRLRRAGRRQRHGGRGGEEGGRRDQEGRRRRDGQGVGHQHRRDPAARTAPAKKAAPAKAAPAKAAPARRSAPAEPAAATTVPGATAAPAATDTAPAATDIAPKAPSGPPSGPTAPPRKAATGARCAACPRPARGWSPGRRRSRSRSTCSRSPAARPWPATRRRRPASPACCWSSSCWCAAAAVAAR